MRRRALAAMLDFAPLLALAPYIGFMLVLVAIPAAVIPRSKRD